MSTGKGRIRTNKSNDQSCKEMKLHSDTSYPNSIKISYFVSFCILSLGLLLLLQSCPTLCDPVDGSPPGSAVPGILQARTLEWVAISFSSAWKWKVRVKPLSRVPLLATSWTMAYQAPPSMGFSKQEYWSGVPLASPFPGSGETKV